MVDGPEVEALVVAEDRELSGAGRELPDAEWGAGRGTGASGKLGEGKQLVEAGERLL